jgi:hypothetical protein
MLPCGVRPLSGFFFADRTEHCVHVTARISLSLVIVRASGFDKPGAKQARHSPMLLESFRRHRLATCRQR